jgi:PRTRC genetic system protein E
MPVTNFFAHIAAIPFEGCLNITVKKDGEQLTTSVLLQNDGCGDAAKNHIPPLILKGTAKELCEGFLDAITTPVAETSTLLVNMEQFLKGQETAKKNAAIEKKKTERVDKADKSDKPTTPEEIKEMKYKGIMAEVDKLEAAGKYREAWIKVPQAEEGTRRTELILDTPKTKNSIREIPISKDLLRILKPFKKIVNPSFFVLTNDAKPTEPRTYRSYYKNLMKELKMPEIKFHGLRHSFATRCIESNCDYKTVSVLLGHSNISTTLNLYVHPNMEQKKKAIEQMFKALR